METVRFQAYRGSAPPRFVNGAERECAAILDWYGIPWEYEPRSFVLERDAEGRVTSAFTPDFYLPEQDLYIEVTVMKQSLVTRKNRKLREVRRALPGRKGEALLPARHRAPRAAVPAADRLVTQAERLRAEGHPIGEVYLGREEIAGRVEELGRELSTTYAGRLPILVAPLKSSAVFLADLSRALEVDHELDVIELAPYGSGRAGAACACSRTSTGRSQVATCCSSRTCRHRPDARVPHPLLRRARSYEPRAR